MSRRLLLVFLSITPAPMSRGAAIAPTIPSRGALPDIIAPAPAIPDTTAPTSRALVPYSVI